MNNENTGKTKQTLCERKHALRM